MTQANLFGDAAQAKRDELTADLRRLFGSARLVVHEALEDQQGRVTIACTVDGVRCSVVARPDRVEALKALFDQSGRSGR